MADLRCKLIECIKCEEVPGTFVAGWYNGFFKLERFAYGRFQFEESDYGYDFDFVTKAGYRLTKGQPVIGFHIPSSGVPLTDEVRLDAYKKAYTDAISVAAKALGVGADVYFEKDKGKYASEAKPAAESVAQGPVKPILSSKGRDWKAAVAFTASQSDSAEVISEKIRSKYDITDDDLELLLKQSGKKS